MNKRIKQLIKKHINIVKDMYPELYIAVIMIGDNILVDVDSQAISNEEKYEDLMYDFIREYHRKGYADIYWGVNSTLTRDNLDLIEDFVKAPEVKITQEKKVANF